MFQEIEADDQRPNQRALLQQMQGPGMIAPPAASGGAYPMPRTVDALPGMTAPPVEKPQYGKDIGKREYMDWGGINADKFNGAHDSPKYQVLRTLSHFDPSQGITPDVLAALNQLGIGTFSGAKDKLQVSGQMDPRFEGFTDVDVIRGFNDPNNKTKAWGYGASNPNAPQGPSLGAGLPSMQSASSSINGLLAGSDPLAAIQAAISQYQKPQSNLQALLQQLQQGQ